MKSRVATLWLVVGLMSLGSGAWFVLMVKAGGYNMMGGIPTPPIPTQRERPITEDVIVYPGAKLIRVNNLSNSTWKHTVYSVNVPHKEVLDYYRTSLPENGWTMGGSFNSPSFLRLEAEGDVSWILSLNVAVEVFEDGATGLHLTTARSPDITNIPLYPGGRIMGNEQNERATITYLTDVGPEEVEEYYKRRLVQEYAWQPNPHSGSIASDGGLIFGYADIGPYPLLTIKATPVTDGQTKVIITLEHTQ